MQARCRGPIALSATSTLSRSTSSPAGSGRTRSGTLCVVRSRCQGRRPVSMTAFSTARRAYAYKLPARWARGQARYSLYSASCTASSARCQSPHTRYAVRRSAAAVVRTNSVNVSSRLLIRPPRTPDRRNRHVAGLHALFDAVDARLAANPGQPGGRRAASKSFGWLKATEDWANIGNASGTPRAWGPGGAAESPASARFSHYGEITDSTTSEPEPTVTPASVCTVRVP